MTNLQGLFDEFESASLAFLALTQYQVSAPCASLDVERSRQEAGRAVIDCARELMNSVEQEVAA
jgi:hypothetical protein